MGKPCGPRLSTRKRQKISVNFLYNEQATDTTDIQQSTSYETQSVTPNEVLQYTSMQYSERRLAYLQVTGENLVKNLEKFKDRLCWQCRSSESR